MNPSDQSAAAQTITGRVISFPPYLNTVALIIGKNRDLFNTEMNEMDPSFKRGERSEFVNILGVKGELIVQDYLFRQGQTCKAAPLIAHRPAQCPDVVVGKFSFDVKTIRLDAPDLLVNEQAHQKAKGITHYWFVQCLTETTAQYWRYSYAEVSAWPVKKVGYTNAYFKPWREAVAPAAPTQPAATAA